MSRTNIDFTTVKAEHRVIDERLTAWGRWCAGRGGAPGDHVSVGRAVAELPIQHRKALQWAYVNQGSLKKLEVEVGVSKAQIAELLHAGRQMLVERKV